MKKVFHAAFVLLLLVVSVLAAYQSAFSTGLEWLVLLVMAVAPLLQLITAWDQQVSLNAKLKQPLVSLLVMLGIAFLLLTVPQPGLVLWAGLAVLGGYLLDTYWARE